MPPACRSDPYHRNRRRDPCLDQQQNSCSHSYRTPFPPPAARRVAPEDPCFATLCALGRVPHSSLRAGDDLRAGRSFRPIALLVHSASRNSIRKLRGYQAVSPKRRRSECPRSRPAGGSIPRPSRPPEIATSPARRAHRSAASASGNPRSARIEIHLRFTARREGSSRARGHRSSPADDRTRGPSAARRAPDEDACRECSSRCRTVRKRVAPDSPTVRRVYGGLKMRPDMRNVGAVRCSR